MIRLLIGDCRTVLSTLADASVHTVVTSPPYYALRSYLHDEHPDKPHEIGLEPSPDLWISTMVGVFREVRRVLRDDGTVFLNVGDSYAGSWGNQGRKPERGTQRPINGPMMQVVDDGRYPSADSNTGKCPPGYKPKDLMMMPARLALALQADGWWVRSDIIWAKPNPMPESCRDRPTSAHEHIFLLSKRARYFYDADAVREPLQDSTIERGYTAAHLVNGGGPKEHANTDRMVRQGKGWWDNAYVPSGRNLRNVWTIATQAYSEARFATFPAALAERCIRAGTSERGCCSQCGKPWVRVTETTRTKDPTRHTGRAAVGCSDRMDADWPRMVAETATVGWQPGCACNAEVRPCTVLDCFSGAGTTALVADRLGRDAIGIDLSHAYVDMARARLEADCPLFADVSPPPAAEDAYDRDMRDLFAEAAE